MAIKLNILKTAPSNEGILYKDFNLEMKLGSQNSNELFKDDLLTDIVTDNNLDAIRNSLVNLIMTSPGQKILTPQFGISFGDLLFLTVTRDRGEVIAQTMLNAIKRFETRVDVINFDITANIELQQYDVNIVYNVPEFNYNSITLRGNLNKTGFYV
jgi:phage baseplate assembly protein W